MTIANQLAFLNFPELLAHTQESSFDPLDLADGKPTSSSLLPRRPSSTSRAGCACGVAIPNAVAGIKPLERDLLIVIR